MKKHRATTSKPIDGGLQNKEQAQSKVEAPARRPEFFALPKAGGDPFFSLTRSWYYAAEKDGRLRLVRIRQRGKLRGVTRVSYDEVAKLFQEARK
jgi:hypothetical protein